MNDFNMRRRARAVEDTATVIRALFGGQDPIGENAGMSAMFQTLFHLYDQAVAHGDYLCSAETAIGCGECKCGKKEETER